MKSRPAPGLIIPDSPGAGSSEWMDVPGPLPVHIRLGADGEVIIWAKLREPAEVDVLFSQVRTLIENRTEVSRRRGRASNAGSGLCEPAQYQLFRESAPGNGARQRRWAVSDSPTKKAG